MFKQSFSIFLKYAMAAMFGLALLVITGHLASNLYSGNGKILMLIYVLIFAFILYLAYANRDLLSKCFSNRKTFILILIIALILRLIWIFLIPTIPDSDFAAMYDFAGQVHSGDYSLFKGNNYFSRFAHGTVTIIYFSLFYNLSSNPLFIIKLVNVFFSTLAIYFIYILGKELINTKGGNIAALLLSIYPPFVMYNSVAMSENMALPLYILCAYFFVKTLKSDFNILYLTFCGFTLSFANMFRMVGSVYIVAFCVYLLIYKGIKSFASNIPIIVAAFLIPMYIISSTLMVKGITERHIWNSKEPAITSILKGTNIENMGKFSFEDGQIVFDNNHDPEKIKEASKQIIKERLTTTPLPKLLIFYVKKLGHQWGRTDLGAISWSINTAKDTSLTQIMKANNKLIFFFCGIISLFIFTFSIADFFKIKKISSEFYFFYILFGGFVLLYLLTEMNYRYSFIISWIFPLLFANFLVNPQCEAIK